MIAQELWKRFVRVGDLALAQLPAWALEPDGEIVARVDGAGATRDFTGWCGDAQIRFSVGAKLTRRGLQAARSPAELATNTPKSSARSR